MPEEMTPKKIEVVAYSGYKANERPLYFIMDNRKLEVTNIIDRWYGVLADDANVYVLKWQRMPDLWFVVRVVERMGKH